MTETTRHPVDLALRAATTTLDPSRADFEYARVKLTEATSSIPRPPTRSRARLSWATGIAVVVVIAIFLVQTAAVSPAEALITELAEVAQSTDQLVIPDDLFAFTLTEATVLVEVGADSMGGIEIEHDSLFYLLPYSRESWSGDQGTVRLQDTTHQPRFFSAADEAAYFAAGLDEGDHIGETIVITQPDTNRALDEDWPTDPGQLETAIRSQVGDDEIAVLNECLVLLREPLVPSELRAAVLQVVAGLDLELVDENSDGGGTFSVEYELEGLGPRSYTFSLNATGYLTFEELVAVDGYPDQGVPAGTAESIATYSVPVLVDSLP